MYQFFGTIRRFPKPCTKTVAIVIISALLLSTPHLCEGSTKINGTVIDQATEQPILDAVVKIESDGQILAETTTDKDGSFRLTQDVQGKKQIQVSSIGYNRYNEMLELTPDSVHTLEISLSSQTFQLAPIEIIGESSRRHRKLTGTMSMLEPDTVDLIKPVGTQELLELIPGINGYADDGFGNSRLSIGIRGLNPRRSARVLILEDGVPIQPALYIYPNAYYNPPADRINAVEVIKSSAALRYGPQTMGGVINYTTRKPDGTKGLANQLTAGNNGYYSAFSEWRGIGNPEKIVSDVQLLYKHGNGFRENNTFDQVNGTVKTLFQLSEEKTLYLKLNGNFENLNATYTGLTEYSFKTDPNFNPKADDNFKILRTSLDLMVILKTNATYNIPSKQIQISIRKRMTILRSCGHHLTHRRISSVIQQCIQACLTDGGGVRTISSSVPRLLKLGIWSLSLTSKRVILLEQVMGRVTSVFSEPFTWVELSRTIPSTTELRET